MCQWYGSTNAKGLEIIYTVVSSHIHFDVWVKKDNILIYSRIICNRRHNFMSGSFSEMFTSWNSLQKFVKRNMYNK